MAVDGTTVDYSDKFDAIIDLFTNQNALLSDQNALLSDQNALLSDQNALLSDQNVIHSGILTNIEQIKICFCTKCESVDLCGAIAAVMQDNGLSEFVTQ